MSYFLIPLNDLGTLETFIEQDFQQAFKFIPRMAFLTWDMPILDSLSCSQTLV